MDAHGHARGCMRMHIAMHMDARGDVHTSSHERSLLPSVSRRKKARPTALASLPPKYFCSSACSRPTASPHSRLETVPLPSVSSRRNRARSSFLPSSLSSAVASCSVEPTLATPAQNSLKVTTPLSEVSRARKWRPSSAIVTPPNACESASLCACTPCPHSLLEMIPSPFLSSLLKSARTSGVCCGGGGGAVGSADSKPAPASSALASSRCQASGLCSISVRGRRREVSASIAL